MFLRKKDQFLEQDPRQCQCDLAQQPQRVVLLPQCVMLEGHGWKDKNAISSPGQKCTLSSQITGLSVDIDEDHFLLVQVSRSGVFLQLLIFLGAYPVWNLCFVVSISAVVIAQNEPRVRRQSKF